MPSRKGRGESIVLGQADWDEVNRITAEIMAGMDCVNPSIFEQHIKQVLGREIASANRAYEAAQATEETHTWKFGQHHISECRVDWCGHYSGQRRDSATRQAQALEDFSRYGCLEPPPAPAGPAAYCARCARSGVGACDDFPYCPGGGKSRESQ